MEGPGDAEIHDLGVPVAVDHHVLGLEVTVEDAQPVGLGQSVRDLLGDGQHLGFGEMSRPPDEAFEVLAGHVLHGDEMKLPNLAQVVHAADVGVGDLAGELELVPEALDRPLVGGDLGLEELERDILLDLLVKDLVDAAHPALADLLDDFVTVGEGAAALEGNSGRLEGQRRPKGLLALAEEGQPALGAVVRLGGVIELTPRASHLDLDLKRRLFRISTQGVSVNKSYARKAESVAGITGENHRRRVGRRCAPSPRTPGTSPVGSPVGKSRRFPFRPFLGH